MMMTKTLATILLLLSFSSCSASQHSEIPLDKKKAGISYGVVNNEEGFEIEILCSKYQVFYQHDDIVQWCKKNIKEIASLHAYWKRKKLEQIDDKQIQINTSRNPLTGIATARGYMKVKWKKPSSTH